MREFLADLKSVLGLDALKRTARKALADDCPGLAGQLAYFVLLTLFPFLMSLVALAGLVVEHPETVLETLTLRMGGFLPQDAVGLVTDYVDRTLSGRSRIALLFAVMLTLGSGSAATQAIIKAANRAYEVEETRSGRRVWVLSVLMILGFMVLVGALAIPAFSLEIGGYLQRLLGLPGAFAVLWGALRWAVAFLAVTLALAVLYYLAPNADLPFKWITPGGFVATALMLVFSVGLRFYVANIARYDEVYGQLGAVVVLMLWLYVTGLMVLLGTEANAVLARMAEERKGVELVESEGQEEETGS